MSTLQKASVALMIAVLIISLGTGYLTYKIYSGTNNAPETVTVTTTVTTPSPTEVTRTLVVTNVTTLPPVTLTETRIVLVNSTVSVPTLATMTESLTITKTQILTETVTKTVTVVEGTVGYGFNELLNIMRRANRSIYASIGTSDPDWVWAPQFLTELANAYRRGIDVKLTIYVYPSEVKQNYNHERNVVQLIIDLGLANITKVYYVYVGTMVIIDNSTIAITDNPYVSFNRPPIIVRPPKDVLLPYIKAFLAGWNSKYHATPLLDWIKRNELTNYFNLPED